MPGTKWDDLDVRERGKTDRRMHTRGPGSVLKNSHKPLDFLFSRPTNFTQLFSKPSSQWDGGKWILHTWSWMSPWYKMLCMSLQSRSRPPYLDQTLGQLADTKPSTVVFKLPSNCQCSLLKSYQWLVKFAVPDPDHPCQKKKKKKSLALHPDFLSSINVSLQHKAPLWEYWNYKDSNHHTYMAYYGYLWF